MAICCSNINSTLTDVTKITIVGTITAAKVLDVDNLQFYNDSVNLDLAGNFEVNIPSGTAVYLKSGGTTYATGYYSGTATAGTVTLIPDSLISAGGSSTAYDLITSTVALMLADTTSVEILAISSDMGSIAMASGVPTVTAGDTRWYDQAVGAATPITWMNPSGGTTSSPQDTKVKLS